MTGERHKTFAKQRYTMQFFFRKRRFSPRLLVEEFEMQGSKGVVALATAMVFVAGVAAAKEAPNAGAAAKNAVATTAAGGKTLYICEDTAMTRRAFAREFGQIEFVTAQGARADGQAWASPKCITSAEARRLKAKSK